MHRIGVVDTMFARYDMGAEVLDEFASLPGHGRRFEIVRRTVPGFKDLAVQAKRLIDEDACRIVVVLGMPGKEPIDKTCAHEASTGIMTAQLMTNTPILEVFVHEDESDDPEVVARICRERARKHAKNAYWMLYEPEELVKRAGQGIRQGFDDAGPLVPGTGAKPASPGAAKGAASDGATAVDTEDTEDTDAHGAKQPAPAAAKLPPPPGPAGTAFGAGDNTASRLPGTAIRSSTSYDGMEEEPATTKAAAPPPPPPPPRPATAPTTRRGAAIPPRP